MKLNLDCMRSLLLEMENISLNNDLRLGPLCEALPDFCKDDIIYSCLKLKEAGFIEAIVLNADDEIIVISVCDITYLGHQFLADIRTDKNWKSVKAVSKQVGSQSINAISQIAQGVTEAFIKSSLGLS